MVVFYSLHIVNQDHPESKLPRRLVVELVKHEEKEVPSKIPGALPSRVITAETVDTLAYILESVK